MITETRKGVTPVIATVLLITIAIGAVSSAAVFFSEVSDEITGGVEDQLSEEERIERTSISIENGFEDQGDLVIDVRNTGQETMPIREDNQDRWSFFIDDIPQERGTDWEYQGDIEDNEDYYVNPQESVRIEFSDQYPDDQESVIISISAPYESSTSTTCHNSGDGDQSC